MGKLNKESSVPLYQQLMEVIQNQILNGELKENDRIPTEIELSREYDVSRAPFTMMVLRTLSISPGFKK